MSQHDDDVSSNDDEQTNGNGHHLPDVLRNSATSRDVVIAVNTLAIEMQLTRKAVARIGTRIANNEQALEERLEAFEALLKRALADRNSGE